MSYELNLTEKERSKFIKNNSFQRKKSLGNNLFFYELDDNYYEKLFLRESEFKLNPKKEKISPIIRNYCKAVEYFSAIDDEKKIGEYKMLIDLFLNSPNVLNLLDNNLDNNDKENFNSMKKILIANKKRKMNNMIEEDGDDISFNSENINFLINQKGKEKLNKLINKDENEIKKKDSVNLINEDIKSQQNKFKQKLLIKRNSTFKKGKNINENNLVQSIQNASINGKKEFEKIIIGEKNSRSIEKSISPIKIDSNSENKENISNNIINSYSNKTNEEENNPLSNITIDKKNTSEFEPLTPENFSKLNKSSNNKSSTTKKMQYNSVEINETNDFTLINDNFSNSNNSNSILQNNKLLKENICSDETKESYNFSNFSNSSKINEDLSSSSFKSNIFKNFRLDFNDLLEYMKDSNITNKQKLFCNDVKIIIENYIKDYNQYLNDNIFMKYLKKYSNLWDDMFKKYVNISDIYDKELKKIDEKINIYMGNEDELKKLENLSENLRNERENEINKSEDDFNSKIESISLEFKNNYNKSDKGILLLNEKFALLISKRIFDMINNNA